MGDARAYSYLAGTTNAQTFRLCRDCQIYWVSGVTRGALTCLIKFANARPLYLSKVGCLCYYKIGNKDDMQIDVLTVRRQYFR